MTEIKSLNEKWTFEHFVGISDVSISYPSIVLVVEPFKEGHNSKFPYKVNVGYKMNNPKYDLNKNPKFCLSENNNFLVVQNDYTDNIDDSLTKDSVELSSYFRIKVF